jgi:hypothetical protein
MEVEIITHNVQGLAMWRYSVIVQPEPLQSKVNVVDVIFYRWDLFVQPGLQLISEQDDEFLFV